MGIYDSLAGVGVSAATGNYIGAAVQGIGLATSIFGGMSASAHAKEAYNIQSTIAGYESQVEDQRHTAMQLAGRRQQMEILRNNQRARAMSTQAAVTQGASLGSGYAGGQAQVQDQSLFNLAGVNQNLEIGDKIFGLNKQISQQKLALSKVQGQMATDQGVSSFGGSLMKAGDPLSRLLQGFGGGQSNSNPYNSMPKAGYDF